MMEQSKELLGGLWVRFLELNEQINVASRISLTARQGPKKIQPLHFKHFASWYSNLFELFQGHQCIHKRQYVKKGNNGTALSSQRSTDSRSQIGRASCRERVY